MVHSRFPKIKRNNWPKSEFLKPIDTYKNKLLMNQNKSGKLKTCKNISKRANFFQPQVFIYYYFFDMASGGLYFSICLLWHITSTLRAGYRCTHMKTIFHIFFSPCCSTDGVDNLIDLMQYFSCFLPSLNRLLLSCIHSLFFYIVSTNPYHRPILPTRKSSKSSSAWFLFLFSLLLVKCKRSVKIATR